MDHALDQTERQKDRRGFTLVEVVISTLIVAIMFVAAMSTVAASRVSQHKLSVSSRGYLLAESLMAEILHQDYEEPEDTVDFGPEPGESHATRTDFDDVDDYHNWSASPPIARDGTELMDSDRWQRSVIVKWVMASDLSWVRTVETDVKRITVTVSYDDVPQATLVAIKTAVGQGEL